MTKFHGFVQCHLRKVFAKLGISSRTELLGALHASESEFASV